MFQMCLFSDIIMRAHDFVLIHHGDRVALSDVDVLGDYLWSVREHQDLTVSASS